MHRDPAPTLLSRYALQQCAALPIMQHRIALKPNQQSAHAHAGTLSHASFEVHGLGCGLDFHGLICGFETQYSASYLLLGCTLEGEAARPAFPPPAARCASSLARSSIGVVEQDQSHAGHLPVCSCINVVYWRGQMAPRALHISSGWDGVARAMSPTRLRA